MFDWVIDNFNLNSKWLYPGLPVLGCWAVVRFLGPVSNSWVCEHYILRQPARECENAHLCVIWDPRKKQMVYTNWITEGESYMWAGRWERNHKISHHYLSSDERAREGEVTRTWRQRMLSGRGHLKALQLWLKETVKPWWYHRDASREVNTSSLSFFRPLISYLFLA